MAPEKPRNINSFLLLPKILVRVGMRKPRQMIIEMIDRKNTISTEGILGSSFTETFISEKKNVDNSIYHTPLLIVPDRF
jgi:hypothetical protein